jgi:hypothetical protein
VQQGGGAPTRDASGNPVTSHLSIAKIRGESPDSVVSNSPQRDSPNHSPTNKEMNHMKPSNAFAEITEDIFQKKEAEKNLYRLDLKN